MKKKLLQVKLYIFERSRIEKYKIEWGRITERFFTIRYYIFQSQ